MPECRQLRAARSSPRVCSTVTHKPAYLRKGSRKQVGGRMKALNCLLSAFSSARDKPYPAPPQSGTPCQIPKWPPPATPAHFSATLLHRPIPTSPLPDLNLPPTPATHAQSLAPHYRYQKGVDHMPLVFAHEAPAAQVDPRVYIPAPLKRGAEGWCVARAGRARRAARGGMRCSGGARGAPGCPRAPHCQQACAMVQGCAMAARTYSSRFC